MENQPQIRNKKKSVLAITSLVLGIAFLIPYASILAIILGIIALIKISKDKQHQPAKGMAIAGIIMGSIGCLFWFTFPFIAPIITPYNAGMQIRTKTIETTSNLSAIAGSQKAYKAEHGRYVSCGSNPSKVPSGTREPWDPSVPHWNDIGFEPMDDVYYQYAVSVSSDGDKFTATATGDLDGDGIESVYTLDSEKGFIERVNALE